MFNEFNKPFAGVSYKREIAVILLGSIVAILLSACGQKAVSNKLNQQDSLTSVPQSSGSNTNGGNSTTVTCSATTCTSPTDYTFVTKYSYTSELTRNQNPLLNNQSFSYIIPNPIVTDSRLRVKITAKQSNRIFKTDGTYSNANSYYDCVSYNVGIAGLNTTKQTVVLSASGNNRACPGAKQSEILSFDDSEIPSGHGPIQITVSEPRYDYYCQLWYSDYDKYFSISYSDSYATQAANYYNGSKDSLCPANRTVYKTHVIGFKLDVEVNTL